MYSAGLLRHVGFGNVGRNLTGRHATFAAVIVVRPAGGLVSRCGSAVYPSCESLLITTSFAMCTAWAYGLRITLTAPSCFFWKIS